MNADDDNERTQFEKAFMRHYTIGRHLLERFDTGYYKSQEGQAAWHIWTEARRDWFNHQNVIRASTIPNTLHIHLRVNDGGIYNTRDGVIDLYAMQAAATHPANIVARTVERYYREMVDAIAATRNGTK